MRRFIVDWWGNFVFFVPVVTIFAGFVLPKALGDPTWTWAIWKSYAVSSIFIAAVGGPAFVAFLKRVWYPLTRTKF